MTTTQSELDELRERYITLEQAKKESDERLAYVMHIAERLKARCEELERHMARYRVRPHFAVQSE